MKKQSRDVVVILSVGKCVFVRANFTRKLNMSAFA